MAKFFSMIRDINGFNGFGLQFPDFIYSADLATSTATSVTVPADENKWIAILAIEPGSSCYVSVNHTAAVPAGSTFASTTSLYNPIGLQVKGGDTVSCITPDTSCRITIAFYALSVNN